MNPNVEENKEEELEEEVNEELSQAEPTEQSGEEPVETPEEETEEVVANELESKLKEAEEKATELNDRYLRLSAEFDNYRKRTLKEKTELILNGSEKAFTCFGRHGTCHADYGESNGCGCCTRRRRIDLYQVLTNLGAEWCEAHPY